MPLVSVVIPVYNGEKYLRVALDSVAAQSMRDFEIIAVDDGSTDQSLKILEAWNKFPIHTIHFTENQGVSKALNAALQHATGTYFAYLAADDIWLPNKLETELAHIKDADVVYSDFYQLFPNREKRLIKCPNALDLKHSCELNISSSLIRMKSLHNIRFNEGLRYCPDWELWQTLARHNVFKHIPTPLSLYRIHDKQCNRSVKAQLETWRFYTKRNGFNLAYSLNCLRAILRKVVCARLVILEGKGVN